MASRTCVLDNDDDSCVPILNDWNRKRNLNLNRADNKFNGHCRFVFVRDSFGNKPSLNGGLFFNYLFLPTAKHFADLNKGGGKTSEFFII
jgi:hypothetical protein